MAVAVAVPVAVAVICVLVAFQVFGCDDDEKEILMRLMLTEMTLMRMKGSKFFYRQQSKKTLFAPGLR